MFIHRIHRANGKIIVAASDAGLKGRVLRDRPVFRVGEFYGEEEIGEEIVELVKASDSANLIGNSLVGLLEEKGIVDPESVVRIGGEKHAVIIRIP